MRKDIVRQEASSPITAPATVEQFVALPAWLTAMRDAMASAVTPGVIGDVMAAQIERARNGDTKAAAFVMDQAHKLLQGERRRPVTITQTNNYYESAPDAPLAVEPGTPKALERMAARLAAGKPIKHPADRKVAAHLRVDGDEAEKDLRRKQAEAEAAEEEAI